MSDLQEPRPLHAVVCENGIIARDAGGLAADHSYASVRSSSPDGKITFCGCKVHRIVQFVPAAREEMRVNCK